MPPGSLRYPPFAPGEVWLVGAGPGDPGLLTLHALHALEQADVVLHDALVPADILALAHGRLESVGKRAGRVSTPQLKINARLIALARAGHRVVRLKGGDPFVFGRGGEEALALAAEGIAFRVIPGVSAGIGGAGAAGVPLTHRGVGRSVAFVTGQHGPGDEPDWAALACGADTIVLYMGRLRMGDIAAALIAGGRSPDEPVLFLADATTSAEQIAATTLAHSGVAAANLPANAAVLAVIGAVTELRGLVGASLLSGPALPAPALSVREA